MQLDTSLNIEDKVKTMKVGGEKNKLFPTPMGYMINGYLIQEFDNLLDYQMLTNKEFFKLVLRDMNILPEDSIMIGDDITSDIEGSINANLKAIQVKTGKFQEKDLKHPTQPNYRIESINDLPKLLGY